MRTKSEKFPLNLSISSQVSTLSSPTIFSHNQTRKIFSNQIILKNQFNNCSILSYHTLGYRKRYHIMDKHDWVLFLNPRLNPYASAPGIDSVGPSWHVTKFPCGSTRRAKNQSFVNYFLPLIFKTDIWLER